MMRLIRLCIVLLVLAVARGASASAQQIAPVGARQPLPALPRVSFARVENSLDPARCGELGVRVRCALGIGVIGALIGAAVGYVATRCDGCENPGAGALLGVPVGFLTGVVLGAVVCRPQWGLVAVPGGAGASP